MPPPTEQRSPAPRGPRRERPPGGRPQVTALTAPPSVRAQLSAPQRCGDTRKSPRCPGGTRREVPGAAGKAAAQSCPGHAALRVRGGLAAVASSHGLPLPVGLAAGGVCEYQAVFPRRSRERSFTARAFAVRAAAVLAQVSPRAAVAAAEPLSRGAEPGWGAACRALGVGGGRSAAHTLIPRLGTKCSEVVLLTALTLAGKQSHFSDRPVCHACPSPMRLSLPP